MSFDEEYIDPHGECAHQISRLSVSLRKADAEIASLRASLERMRAVVEAARKLATEGRYIAGMADDDPFKGNGNRLVDAIAALDATERKTP